MLTIPGRICLYNNYNPSRLEKDKFRINSNFLPKISCDLTGKMFDLRKAKLKDILKEDGNNPDILKEINGDYQ